MKFDCKLFVTHDRVAYRMSKSQPENDLMVSVIAGNGPLKHLKITEGSVVNAYSVEVLRTKSVIGHYYVECQGNRGSIFLEVNSDTFRRINKDFSRKPNYSIIIYTLDEVNWHLYAY